MYNRIPESLKGINELEEQLVKYSDFVIVNKIVEKANRKVLEGKYYDCIDVHRIVQRHRLFLDITKYSLNPEIISVKIICRENYYNKSWIESLIDKIMNNGEYKVELTIV